MLPLLDLLADGEPHSMRELTEHISNVLNLTDEDEREMLASGQTRVIVNRVGDGGACT